MVHTIKQIAHTENEANAIVLKFLRSQLGTDNFEII